MTRRRIVARAAVGLFIVLQLLYLAAANSLNVLESYRPALVQEQPARAVAAVTQRWSDLSGQPQDWSLFSPSIGQDATFLAVEFRWDAGREEPVVLLSDNEPADPHRYFRLGRMRLRRCEMKLELSPPEPDELAVSRDGWNRRIDTKARTEWRRIRAYLRWRLEKFRQEHDDWDPPTEAVLLLRRYRIPLPDRSPWDWDGPDTLPVARYVNSGVPPGAEYLPLERYNPVVDRFELMRRGN